MFASPAGRHTGGMRIFIVEDSEPVLERVTALLGAIPGVSVAGSAGTVREAIDGILATRPEVVVLDLSLGNESGFEVLRAVHGRAPAIDFYMLSNFASEPYRRHAEQLGARGFFDKTTEFERVRKLVAARAAPH